MGKRFSHVLYNIFLSGDIKSKLIGKYHPMSLPRHRQPHINNKSAKELLSSHAAHMAKGPAWRDISAIISPNPRTSTTQRRNTNVSLGKIIFWLFGKLGLSLYVLYTFFSIFGLIRMNGLIFQIAILYSTLFTSSVHFLFLAFLLPSLI